MRMGNPRLDHATSRTQALRISSVLSSNGFFLAMDLCSSTILRSGYYRKGDFRVYIPLTKVFKVGSEPLPQNNFK